MKILKSFPVTCMMILRTTKGMKKKVLREPAMIDYAMIILAFLLFFIYDYNQLQLHQTWLRPAFFLGCMLILTSVLHAVCTQWHPGAIPILLMPALLSAALLIYVLFFALPFTDTYIREAQPAVCRTGCYALCRHPGFWMLALCLGFLTLAIHTIHILLLALLCSLCNLLYVLFQDRYSFPLQFADYVDYRQEVPFLIMTRSSLQQCRKTWR